MSLQRHEFTGTGGRLMGSIRLVCDIRLLETNDDGGPKRSLIGLVTSRPDTN